MFAVLKTGGKQYKVAAGQVIKVEKLDGDVGSTIQFDEILMIGDDKGVKVGEPTLKGAAVMAEILEQTRAAKITVFKKKRRHNYRRKKGHRQNITVLRVTDIAKTAAKKAAPKKVEAVEEKAPAKAPAKKAPAKKAAEKAPAKKAAPKKAAAKTTTAKKAPAKKAPAKKAAAKKATK